MIWLSISVNLSTSIGHDSLNLLACENKKAPNATMTEKARNKVITIAINLFILLLTKKFTIGWSRMARMVAKTRGTIMPLAM